jgi:hypothetical protein
MELVTLNMVNHSYVPLQGIQSIYGTQGL